MTLYLLLCAFLAGFPHPCASPAPKVGRISLEGLTRYSEAIFVGRVEEVLLLEQLAPEESERAPVSSVRRTRSVPVAKVRVEQPWKGVERGEVVYYLAMGTWTCDISSATTGETALFFLYDSEWSRELAPATRAELERRTGSAPLRVVAHAGRGRMPLRSERDEQYATYWGEVVLPRELPTIAGPEEARSFIRSVQLESLEARVGEFTAAQLPYFSLSHSRPSESRRGWSLQVWGDGQALLELGEGEQRSISELQLAPETLAELEAALRDASAAGLPARLGQAPPGGPTRVFEGRASGVSLSFELHTLAPSLVSGAESRRATIRALRLWARLRALFDEPGALDAREGDRACIEAW